MMSEFKGYLIKMAYFHVKAINRCVFAPTNVAKEASPMCITSYLLEQTTSQGTDGNRPLGDDVYCLSGQHDDSCNGYNQGCARLMSRFAADSNYSRPARRPSAADTAGMWLLGQDQC